MIPSQQQKIEELTAVIVQMETGKLKDRVDKSDQQPVNQSELGGDVCDEDDVIDMEVLSQCMGKLKKEMQRIFPNTPFDEDKVKKKKTIKIKKKKKKDQDQA